MQKKIKSLENIVLIAPDAGSLHKIHKLAEAIGYKGDIITCSKERDADGKLSKTVVPIPDNNEDNIEHYNKFYGRDFIIVDDILDGGKTFINIAKEIKRILKHENYDCFEPKIYLIVTHGIFSAGFDELSEYFDGIYCTNSYQDIERDSHFSEDLIFDKQYDDKVKQLNIFQ